ncbi:MAG: bifunctional oligoribonuclease/PAP phosphatase NrnA [Chloroflexi bacterium]|nr:bifunctional oligoribonuclease/PAP phosphatase NrnA [Chloroflexota bacterium]
MNKTKQNKWIANDAEMQVAALKQASQLVQSSHYPLLICHVAPDGDAVGSLVGLGRALRQMGLDPILACTDPIPAKFNYIPSIETVVREISDPFDLIISLDCSDLERLGRFVQIPAFESAPLLNIDHHITNLNFGDVNLVDDHASSTAEVVLGLLEYMAIPIDSELATCLLTGIVTDTRGFRTSNVNAQVMEAALRLMNAGASLPYITQHSLDCRPTTALLLWRESLSSLQIDDRIARATISQTMRRAAGYLGNGDAGLVSFLISADDADVAVVFVEREIGRVEVSLRAVPGYDVAQVALQFGGGGHALAAGCSFFGSLEEAQTQILAALQDVMRDA